MGLSPGDLEKVPNDLQLTEYYSRILRWHRTNKERIHEKMRKSHPEDPYIICYFELLEALPSSDIASAEDIAFVCTEVISGLMEWAYHEADSHGVKTAAYAHHILDKFFDGFGGSKTRSMLEGSGLYPHLSMSGCLDRHRKQAQD